MVHRRWQICIAVAMALLCGCAQRAESTVMLSNSIQQAEEQKETGETEELTETGESGWQQVFVGYDGHY
ncbi:MAG: hypothetical protein K2M91_14455 [Lachnospiraceae bacterium]|nr:hypothetical protein [Lachnospiraceae bacterium]